MGIILWVCAIGVVCLITGVIFYKPYLGIAFVIISIPFEGHIIFDGISFYPLEVILAIIIFVCVIKLIVRRENHFRNTKLILFYLPFVLCLLISSLKSMEISLTIKEIVRWLELIVVYFLTINLVTERKEMKVVLYSMILTTAIVSTAGIIDYLDGRHRVFSIFDNPNPFAGYVNLIIPVIFGMLMASAFLWERIALGIFIALLIIAWFLTFSRAGWLSLISTMVIVFFLTKIKKRVTFLMAIILAIFAVTFLFSNIKDDFMDRFTSESTQRVFDSKALCYQIGFNMVKDDLVFGIGTGNYPLLIKKFTASMNQYSVSYITKNDLHNLYLQILVEVGLMGLCAFAFWLTCIIKYLVSALKSLRNSRNYDLFVGLMGGIIVYLFNNLASVLTVHGIHLQWGIIIGLAVVLIQFRESEKCPETD